MMHGAMELFPTATCETYLTMSTQIAFTCDACEMKFQEETSLMEHRMQDYQVRTHPNILASVSTSSLSRPRPSSNKPCNS